jgi:hypothetical protein
LQPPIARSPRPDEFKRIISTSVTGPCARGRELNYILIIAGPNPR